ncbi:MAG: aminotransferase class V-fold PLP-dependent enzyme, partial [Acidiferrobacterales bacterium]
MKDHYYLDNAATTWPKPETVYTTMDQFFRSYGVNPGRAGHDMAVEAEKMIAQTRRMLAAFFNYRGDPNRVVFTQNATDSLNMALYGLLSEGDHVVTTRLEHNSVLRPLNHLQREHGVTVTYVRRDVQGYIDPEDIRKAITPKTKVLVVNHASNVLGSVQDLEAIG